MSEHSNPVYDDYEFFVSQKMKVIAMPTTEPSDLVEFGHRLFDLQTGSYTTKDLISKVGKGTKIVQIQVTIVEGVSDIHIGYEMTNLQAGATYQFLYKPGLYIDQININVNSGFCAVEVLTL